MPQDPESWHPLAQLLNSTRCLYAILTDEDSAITPFTLFRSGLVQTYPAFKLLAGLPVSITDIVRPRVIAEDTQARHAVFLLSTENIEEFTREFDQFPFCALLDVRNPPTEEEVRHPGWHYQASERFSVDAIIDDWTKNAKSAVDRIAERWDRPAQALLSVLATELSDSVRKRADDLVRFPPQHCVEHNGILANLVRYGCQNEIFRATASPLDLEDIDVVQRTQEALADEVRSARVVDQIPAFLIGICPNPHFSRRFESIARRRAGLKSLIHSLLNERTYIFHAPGKELASATFNDVRGVFTLKTVERHLVDAVALSAAAARGAVVFRTPQLPAQLYQRLENLAQMNWSEREKTRSMVKWDRLCDELSEAVGKQQLEWLAEHARRITAISDLPLEWCKVNNIPLCFLRPICRIPLALGECMGMYSRDLRPPTVWRSVENLRVLVVNGHSRIDKLRYYPELLARQSHEQGFQTQLCRTADEQELVDQINGFQPHLLIVSAHGIVDSEEGGLICLADGDTPLRLEQLSWKPDAAIVSACRAEAVVRTFGSPASNLYAAGIRSVLGSYLDLTEPHASMMVSAILVNLHDALAGVQTTLTNWHDLVTMTLLMRRPVDVLVAASRWHKRRNGKGDPLELFQAYTTWHNNQSDRDIVTSWSNTIDQLISLAQGTPYLKAVTAMKRSHAFRPESMFYTQIGEPHRILLGTARFTRHSEVSP